MGQFRVTVGTSFQESPHVPLYMWLQAFFLLAGSKKGISSNQLHRTLGVNAPRPHGSWAIAFVRPCALAASRRQGASMSGIVEIDETIYGRAATHPKGRRRQYFFRSAARATRTSSCRWSSAAVRCAATTWPAARLAEVIPIVTANVSKEAAVMKDSAQLYKYRLGDFASHDRVDHSEDEYVRYEPAAP